MLKDLEFTFQGHPFKVIYNATFIDTPYLTGY